MAPPPRTSPPFPLMALDSCPGFENQKTNWMYNRTTVDISEHWVMFILFIFVSDYDELHSFFSSTDSFMLIPNQIFA